MWPDPSIRYRRAEQVSLRSRAEGHEQVWDGRHWVEVPRAFELLSHFTDACGPGEVFDRMAASCRSAVDGLAVLRSLALLVETGVVLPDHPPREDGRPPMVLDCERRFHRSMLADVVRVDAFLDAVRAQVQPGDVVIDAGTGSGVLAVAAARAGARCVYAVENGTIAEVAEQVFADNGVADRVRLVRADVRTMVLPERADLLVTETIGANPFDEGILELVAALAIHLRPGARLVPSRLALRAAPLAMPDNIARAWMPTDEDLLQWRARQQIDLSALTVDPALRAAPMPVDLARLWMVAEPATVFEVALADTFARPTSPVIEGTTVVPIMRGGVVNAVALGFSADLGAGYRIDSWTSSARADSWDVSVVRLPAPVVVAEGQSLTIRVEQPVSGETPTVSIE